MYSYPTAQLETMQRETRMRLDTARLQRRLMDIAAVEARIDAIITAAEPLIVAARNGTADAAMMETGKACKAEMHALRARLTELGV